MVLTQSNLSMTAIKIGSIVSLKTHPYLKDLTTVIISGDAQHTAPIMIVTEIFIESKNLYDEQTGDSRGKQQCKCIWYSSNNGQFEEVWISEKQLKVIEEPEDKKEQKSFAIGEIISLKTLNLELEKKKSYIKGNGYNNENITITSLLTFVPPVMQVVGESKNESKEPLFDNKTGKPKRFVSSKFIKCNWYNPNSNKVSEKHLPIEALRTIKLANEDSLRSLHEMIVKKEYCKFTYKEQGQLIQPRKIIYVSGYYYLVAHDFLTNKMQEFEVLSIEDFEVVEKYYVNKSPDFDILNGDFSSKNINNLKVETIKQGIESQKYMLIVYKNKNDIFSTRTLKDYQIIDTREDDKIIENDYLVGHCLLKDEKRHFKVDRIQSVEILDLNY